jgi:biopolymer transport protein TolR
MGMSPNNGSGGRGRRAYQPMSEINVTPFVDVMLVLLVIFMVTAPLLAVGVPVNIPESKAQNISRPDKPLVISIQANGEVYLQETKIELASLVAKLRAITNNKRDTRIYVRGDRAVAYGRIMEVMGTVSSAGFAKVTLLAKLPDGGR